MEWIKWIVGLIIIVYLIRRFWAFGRIDFWKVAHKNGDLAYDFFKENDCWIVFEERPIEGYREELPPGEWDGPFIHVVPKLNRRVRLYGKVGEYEKSEDEFLNRIGRIRII